MESSPFEQPGGTWYDAQHHAAEQSARWWLWGGIGGATALALAFLAGFLGGYQPVASLQQTSKRLEHQLNAAQHQEQILLLHHHCTSDDSQIRDVQQLLQAGQPDAAVAFIEIALRKSSPPACPQTRVELGALAYTARLNALFSRVEVSPLDRGPLLGWLSAERQADVVGVPSEQRLSPISVAIDAYNAHLWPLARAAFLRAWQQGSVGPGDVDRVALYYAICRNEGLALIRKESGALRQQGLMVLRTADAISATYRLDRGEARADLTQILGPSVRSWPEADRHDAVLADARQH